MSFIIYPQKTHRNFHNIPLVTTGHPYLMGAVRITLTAWLSQGVNQTTYCSEGVSAVTINVEMKFQRMYIHSSIPSQTVLRTQFCIVFLLTQHDLTKITGFSMVHSTSMVEGKCHFISLYIIRKPRVLVKSHTMQ